MTRETQRRASPRAAVTDEDRGVFPGGQGENGLLLLSGLIICSVLEQNFFPRRLGKLTGQLCAFVEMLVLPANIEYFGCPMEWVESLHSVFRPMITVEKVSPCN